MQGLESLSQFQNFMSSLGGLGRFGDTYMIHAEEGETVVPMEVLDRNPLLKKRLFKSMKALGIDPGRYIVGNDLNSLNPVTGQPEFFLKKISKWVQRVMPGQSEQYLGPLVGLATGNPFLGAGAGYLGTGDVGGAITGGGAGYFSPGLTPFGGKASGIMELLRGSGQVVGPQGPMMPTKGIFGKGGEWGLGEGTVGEWTKDMFGFDGEKLTASQINDKVGIEANRLADKHGGTVGEWISTAQSNVSKDTGIPMGKIIKWGLALGALEKFTSKDQDIGDKYEYAQTGDIYENILNPKLVAEGGIMDLQGGGESRGPGTGTSDSIPAMLSDGEFVMTADAVRGAGGGDRREGARKMYQMMDGLEARA